MIRHSEIGKPSFATSRKLKALIDNGLVTLGGNKNLKIYGTLACRSGKRMKVENRVFFSSEQEAIANGYRPCGHCMKKEYQDWKILR
ncbi:MAG: Ada metal-binding domain-containing protein [Dyadobacter sp.]|uniref:Ada metal-binding domain-containing protein n=1 Tax=Dyadobacter sp. TaxID=1914288 RepID=UPI00326731FD